MKIHQLDIKSNPDKKRRGRGISAGQGKTAGRGTKGQSSRSGGKVRPGFEGGQNPYILRVPKKRGFSSRKTPAVQVRTSQLNLVKGSVVDREKLYEAGIINNEFCKVKLIKKGEIKSKLTVKLDGASKGAIEVIESKGGTFIETSSAKRSES
ncbi:50S ribosomal protein L15 [Candidatus Saccharibacteria bacterium CPR2]|nr:50S ribosomal protein L15 [Candidatus Saccharibacteria bacterium CPR2]